MTQQGLFIRDYEQKVFIQRRQEFLDALMRHCEYNIIRIQMKDKIAIACNKKYDKIIKYSSEFKLYTFKAGEILAEGEYYDGINFNPLWNTRDILLSECVIELEKGKSWEENIKAFWETVRSLMYYKIHFAVFYAQEMRTPHIHIYNLFPDVVDWAEKELSMALFCRKIVPFEYFHLLDTSLWGQHTISLEFAKHYRTGHIKKLLFEHVPEVENAT